MAYKNTPNMVCMHMKSEMTHVSRNRGIDVVRVLMTLLVIFHHAAIGYGGSGGWFWREQPNASSSLLVMFNAINQSYFMGVFFLLAGYYTPKSYVRKGTAKFLMDRLLRLGLPLLTFFFILYPFTVAIAQAGQGRPLIKLWWDLIIAGKFGPGPLWFAIALLIFAMCYAIWQTCRRRAGWSAVSVDARFGVDRLGPWPALVHRTTGHAGR